MKISRGGWVRTPPQKFIFCVKEVLRQSLLLVFLMVTEPSAVDIKALTSSEQKYKNHELGRRAGYGCADRL